MVKRLTLAAVLFSTLHVSAQVKLARIFSDHMVLQRSKPIQIWGWAKPGEKISVSLAGNSRNVKAGKNGGWSVTLPPMMAGGPHELILKANNSIALKDIMVGEVWLCSGQSNMEWTVSNSRHSEEEIRNGNYPMIRHFKVPHTASLQPENDLKGGTWEICEPSKVANFTAVGYFFARELTKQLQIPIGLINSSWGGTNVETWISGESFFADPEFAALKNRMPGSFDSIVARRKAKMEQVIRKVQPNLPMPVEARFFSKPDFNDANWSTMNLPAFWEDSGLPDIDGTIWFRREFQVPADSKLQNAKLRLGPIDDMDSTFVNGILVGTKDVWNEDRVYMVPANIIKTSGNIIAIKVTDTGGGGGVYGEPGKMQLDIGGHIINLAGNWKFQVENVLEGDGGVDPNAYPTLLYNGMIHAITHYPIRGAIWYQGESNAGRATQYRTSFPLMINDWRKLWKEEFPFLFVQLASYEARGGTSQNGGSEWAELREAQEDALQLSHTGMAVIVDIGETSDIHPKNKQDVGKRLAANALANVYGTKVSYCGPTFSAIEIKDNKAIISFTHVSNGLTVRNKYGYINGFEIAGTDRKFRYARAYVEGDKVIVFSDDISNPVAVRYAWSDDPNDVNLYNKEGFPAAPFRTDKWPLKTDGKKYSFE